MSVLIFLVVVGVLIFLAAPFVDYFAPASNYHIVHEHTLGEPVTVLVSGSEILWYFWQSYLYIALGMGFVLLMIFCFIFAIYKHYAVEIDQEIKDEQSSMIKTSFTEIFSTLPDPRTQRTLRHPLINLSSG